MARILKWICRIVSGFFGLGLVIILYETITFPNDVYDIPWGTGGCLDWNYETPEIYYVSSLFLCLIMTIGFVASLPMAKKASYPRIGIFLATFMIFVLIGRTEADRDLIYHYANRITLDHAR